MKKKQKKGSLLLKAGGVVAIGMLLGRVAGFAREVILAKTLGVSGEADIAVLLLTFPDLLIALFVGGAANFVFIPRFQELEDSQKNSFFASLSAFVFIFFLFLSIALYFLTPTVIKLLGPGLQSNLAPAVYYFKILVWAIPIVALTAVSRAYLQSSFRFMTTSLENFLFNVVIIVSLVWLYAEMGLVAVLLGIYVGAMVRWLSQLANIFTTNKSSFNIFLFKIKRKKQLLASYAEALSAGLIIAILPIFARSMASLFLGEGAIAIFNYSFKIIELPFGVAISIFSVVMLPKLSELFLSANTYEEAINSYNRSITCLIALSVPMSFGLICFFWKLYADSVSLFSLDTENMKNIYLLSIFGFGSLFIRGVSSMNLAVFSAKKDTRAPLHINAGCFIACAPLLYFMTSLYKYSGLGMGLLCFFSLVFFAEAATLIKKYRINMFQRILNLSTFFVFSITGASYTLFYSLTEGSTISILSYFICCVAIGAATLGINLFLGRKMGLL